MVLEVDWLLEKKPVFVAVMTASDVSLRLLAVGFVVAQQRKSISFCLRR